MIRRLVQESVRLTLVLTVIAALGVVMVAVSALADFITH